MFHLLYDSSLKGVQMSKVPGVLRCETKTVAYCCPGLALAQTDVAVSF
jgi:hypothetical protein